MKDSYRKLIWTALFLLCCVPVSFAQGRGGNGGGWGGNGGGWGSGGNGGCGCKGNNCAPLSVPEGGSSATYLAGASLICASALLVSSRKRAQAK